MRRKFRQELLLNEHRLVAALAAGKACQQTRKAGEEYRAFRDQRLQQQAAAAPGVPPKKEPAAREQALIYWIFERYI